MFILPHCLSTEVVRPICLDASAGTVSALEGTTAVVAGWGATTFGEWGRRLTHREGPGCVDGGRLELGQRAMRCAVCALTIMHSRV